MKNALNVHGAGGGRRFAVSCSGTRSCCNSVVTSFCFAFLVLLGHVSPKTRYGFQDLLTVRALVALFFFWWLVTRLLFMVCILPCRNWRVKVLTSFVYIVESAILHLARFKFRMNRLVREIARLAVVANPVSIYVPDKTFSFYYRITQNNLSVKVY